MLVGATILVESGVVSDNESLMSNVTQPAKKVRREPHLLRFSLRHMLQFVAFCSVLLALMTTTGGAAAMIIAGLTLLVGAHVVANLIGTRLRETSHEVRQWRAERDGHLDQPVVGSQQETLVQISQLKNSPLADFSQTTLWIMRLVVTGAVCGALLGAMAMALLLGGGIGWAGWVVGTISSAVLGAWAAFVTQQL